jgi:hypothetical protein
MSADNYIFDPITTFSLVGFIAFIIKVCKDYSDIEDLGDDVF